MNADCQAGHFKGGFLYRLRVETNYGSNEVVEEEMFNLGIRVAAWEDEEQDIVHIDAYFDELQEAEEVSKALSSRLEDRLSPGAWRLSVEKLAEEDWQESWKRFFVTERISDRIVIKPSWEHFDALPTDRVIELDPGMSFGTGHHPTTRACLRFLDMISRENKGLSFLDLGCGSGILSIAAAKLGFGSMEAVDIDPHAVEIAKNNAERNAVADEIGFIAGDIAELSEDRPYDVVAANILLDTLRSNSEHISSIVEPGGFLLIAGILTTQYPEIKAVYSEHGFSEIESVTENEWTSGWFQKNQPLC